MKNVHLWEQRKDQTSSTVFQDSQPPNLLRYQTSRFSLLVSSVRCGCKSSVHWKLLDELKRLDVADIHILSLDIGLTRLLTFFLFSFRSGLCPNGSSVWTLVYFYLHFRESSPYQESCVFSTEHKRVSRTRWHHQRCYRGSLPTKDHK